MIAPLMPCGDAMRTRAEAHASLPFHAAVPGTCNHRQVSDSEAERARSRIHSDVSWLAEILRHHDVHLKDVTAERFNGNYSAATARCGDRLLRIRVGRQTPTKSGHFVATWQRDHTDRPVPYQDGDGVAALVVVVRQGLRSGAFVFTRAEMRTFGLVALDGTGGKNGFRVYPAWSHPESDRGQRTMLAQSSTFFDLGDSSEARAAFASKVAEI